MSQKKFTLLLGCGVKSIGPIFKTEILIYQSKANLDEEILLGKTTYHLDLEIRKTLVIWERGIRIPFWSMIYLLLKLIFYF